MNDDRKTDQVKPKELLQLTLPVLNALKSMYDTVYYTKQHPMSHHSHHYPLLHRALTPHIRYNLVIPAQMQFEIKATTVDRSFLHVRPDELTEHLVAQPHTPSQVHEMRWAMLKPYDHPALDCFQACGLRSLLNLHDPNGARVFSTKLIRAWFGVPTEVLRRVKYDTRLPELNITLFDLTPSFRKLGTPRAPLDLRERYIKLMAKDLTG